MLYILGVLQQPQSPTLQINIAGPIEDPPQVWAAVSWIMSSFQPCPFLYVVFEVLDRPPPFSALQLDVQQPPCKSLYSPERGSYFLTYDELVLSPTRPVWAPFPSSQPSKSCRSAVDKVCALIVCFILLADLVSRANGLRFTLAFANQRIN